MAEIPLSGKSRTQVLRWQRQCWVVGLRWEEKQKSVRSVRRPLVQRRGVLNVMLTVKQGKSRLTAQGQIEAGSRHQKLYSLAALFSQQCTPNGYGEAEGTTLKTTHAQELVACKHGFRNWQAAIVGLKP